MTNDGLFTKIVTYSAVFALGYYLAGGCDYTASEKKPSSMERIMDQYQKRVDDLEQKIENLKKK